MKMPSNSHRLQEHGDRADIFAERAVILECECQDNADNIIDDVADDERIPHYRPFVLHAEYE